jgi:hypothetical protein
VALNALPNLMIMVSDAHLRTGQSTARRGPWSVAGGSRGQVRRRGVDHQRFRTHGRWTQFHPEQHALEVAGVEFIDDQAKSFEGGPGVRLPGAQKR